MSEVRLSGLEKRFGRVVALAPTDLTVASGEFLVIVGPSGCGKSTLLRLIAGLEAPSAGRVSIGGRDATDAPPAARGVAMVFQSYALYPHLSVRGNIAFPLKVLRRPREEIARRVEETAEALGLSDLLDRKPRELSGGQRQRVSIGRAIVRRPAVLLLDEPLSNLDAGLRVRLRHELARLHQSLGVTMIHVTHDQAEAMTLADRIVVMESGRVEQVGAPLELYTRPASLAVARALGAPAINLLPATVAEADAQGGVLRLADGERVRTAAALPAGSAGAPVTLGVRPEHLRAATSGPFTGAVELFERLGPLSFAHLGARGAHGTVVAQLPGEAAVTLGDTLSFEVAPERALVFDAAGRALPSPPLSP